MGRCEFLREYAHFHWADDPDCSHFDVLNAVAVSHPHALDGAKRRNSVEMVKSALKLANQGKPFISNADRKRVHRNSKKIRVSPFIKMVVNSRRGGAGNSVRRVTGVLQQAGFVVEKSTVGSVMKQERDRLTGSLSSISMVSASPVVPEVVSAVQDVAMTASPMAPEVVGVGVTRDLALSESSSNHSAPAGPMTLEMLRAHRAGREAALSDGSVSSYHSAPTGPMTLEMLRAHRAGHGVGSTDLNLSESSSVDIPLPPELAKYGIVTDSPVYSAASHPSNHSPSPDGANLSSSHHSEGSSVHSEGSSVNSGSSGKYSMDELSQGPEDSPPVAPTAKPVVTVRNKYLDPAPYDTEPVTAPSKGKSTMTLGGATFVIPNGVSSSSCSESETASSPKPKPKPWDLKKRCALGMFVSSKKKTDSNE